MINIVTIIIHTFHPIVKKHFIVRSMVKKKKFVNVVTVDGLDVSNKHIINRLGLKTVCCFNSLKILTNYFKPVIWALAILVVRECHE
ncbi:MAG: hypothetical protein ACI87J_002738 [Colwellia sp.]|jgi:hypothetical protein